MGASKKSGTHSVVASPETHVLDLTRRLLESIAQGDWQAYCELCDDSLTAFEPEARGQLVKGLPFHKFYFDLERSTNPVQNTICSPEVRMLGADAAVVSYVRLNQSLAGDGKPVTSRMEETRVWQRSREGQWRHVHFHRSANS